jgi:hypothetical protein
MREDRGVGGRDAVPPWRKPSVETRARRLLMVARRRDSDERRRGALGCVGTQNAEVVGLVYQTVVMHMQTI